MEPIFGFVIIRQNDVSESDRSYADLDVTESGVPFVTAYRTKAAAVAAMAAKVPSGKDPGVYAGLSVQRRANNGLFVFAS